MWYDLRIFMDKAKMWIVSALVFVLVLDAAVFGVLYAEESKKMKQDRASEEAALQSVRVDDARKRYYEKVAGDREKLREQMAQSKKQYDDLLAEQPGLVANQQEQVTKTVETVVPVTTTETVSTTGSTASKPKSTKSTKTS